jgi:hypothetical protein
MREELKISSGCPHSPEAEVNEQFDQEEEDHPVSSGES